MGTHLLTFDIEHWFESHRLRGISGWEKYPPRDHLVVERLFDLLGKQGQTATFFFTGRYARDFPNVVKRCSDLGHEVASHSDQHILITRMTGPEEFRRDLVQSLDILKNITGKPVLGYRAPKWSVVPENQDWVLTTLVDEGLVYDSSFFPKPGADIPRLKGIPHIITLEGERRILEIPATGYNLGSICLPVAGGFYFRIFPRWITQKMLNQKERLQQHGMLYVHPYDLDIDCPVVPGGGVLFYLFRTAGVKGAWNKLEGLLGQNRFTSIERWLASQRDLQI